MIENIYFCEVCLDDRAYTIKEEETIEYARGKEIKYIEQTLELYSKSSEIKAFIKERNNNNNKLTNAEIFTTCPETIYGITFMVMAPEHELISKLKDNIKNYEEVKKYQEETRYRSELNRISNQKEKTGCILDGLYAINPVNGRKVPIYIADFVLAGYFHLGTKGAAIATVSA